MENNTTIDNDAASAKKEKLKKILDIVKKVAVWLVVAFAAIMMIFTIITVTTVDRNQRSIFGLMLFKVTSDSMSATDFSAGDLIFVKKVKDLDKLKAGDIITFQSANAESFGQIVTHKIRERVTTPDGLPGFITYGTTTDTNDREVVTYNFVIGKYTGRLPGMGKFFEFLRTTPGYIVCIFLPFLLLILFQGWNSFQIFRQYKSEQNEAIAAEKASIAAERAESERVKAELIALKQQLGITDDAQLNAAIAEQPETESTASEPAEAESAESAAEPEPTEE